ncbi:MAG: PP2C family protein-serine/threonine phosphatase [Oscillospiraceae bacterium]|nr:PP2C family protein-serine/threonine phosphatase [Oscillospiraceae bacterium]
MKKKRSVKVRVAVAAIVFMSILTLAIASIGYKLYHDTVMDSYITYTNTVLEYAYRASVKYGFGDMIAQRDMPEGYEEFREELNAVKDSSDINYLYAIYFDDIEDMHSLHYAINAKTQAELSTGKPLSEIFTYMGKPCEVDAFEDDTLMTFWDAVRNGKRDIGILKGDSDAYGRMLNGYHVIYDSQDNAVGLLCVEIKVTRINKELRHYIFMVILTASLLTAAIILLYLFRTERYLVKPIVAIAKNSDDFVKKMQSHAEPEELTYEEVDVRTDGELRLLADNVKSLADGVAAYMTNLKAATAERERIGTELQLATRIQADMLPSIFPPFPERHDFEIYASMTPAKEVGGDFYDFFLLDEDHLGIVMADVSGKGVPAALFMMMSKILINNFVMQGFSPAKVLEQINQMICQNNKARMFVTVWLGILEISTGKITAVNAGHEYPIIRTANGDFEVYKDEHSFIVGGIPNAKYREYEMQLEKGGMLLLYTDGLAEAMDASRNMFGLDRLVDVMNQNKTASPEALLKAIRAAVDTFVGDTEQSDDLTMLGIRL